MKHLLTRSCLVLLLSATISFAADPNSIAGVYKYQFKNGTVDGGKYQSENILEIVPYGADAIYFRTSLDFYNGHVCGLSGIAHPADQGFIFEEKEDHCEFTLQVDDDGKITFHDKDMQCKQSSCGMRGAYEGITFKPSQKRPIRYMARLKQSREYRAAVIHDTDGTNSGDAFTKLWQQEQKTPN